VPEYLGKVLETRIQKFTGGPNFHPFLFLAAAMASVFLAAAEGQAEREAVTLSIFLAFELLLFPLGIS
jgi:hypothetical protein